jgi:hypothetical protein
MHSIKEVTTSTRETTTQIPSPKKTKVGKKTAMATEALRPKKGSRPGSNSI